MTAAVERWTPKRPVPHGVSLVAEQIAHCITNVPAGNWVSFKDLAEVVGSSPRGVASAGFTLDAGPVDETVDHWTVPWHRVRLDDGGNKNHYDDPRWQRHVVIGDLLWEAEGGRWATMRGGAYPAGRRFPLAAWVRRQKAEGHWPFP